MHLPKPSEGGDFTPPPAGTHAAICYRVIDLGTQQTTFNGQAKHQRKIMLSWELPDEKMEDGRPFTVSNRYTFSTFEKATFRQHLESWRGKSFTDADFGPGGFDIRNVLGVPCLLGVTHKESNGKTYANVTSVSKLLKGMAVPPLTNEKVYFSLDESEWTPAMKAIFDGLSDGLKAAIAKSPEYVQVMYPNAHTNGERNYEPPAQPPMRGDMDDDIPF